MRLLNPANLITLARLLAAIPVIWAILNHRFTLALVVLLLAGISDALDGPLARRRGAVTKFGAYLDPVSDKVLLSGSYLALWGAGVAPGWLVAIIFGRDALIVAGAGAVLALTPLRDFTPSRWGKLSTVVQVVAGVALLTSAACPWPPLARIAGALVWFAAAATLWSGLDYARQTLARLRRLRPA